MAQQAAVEMDTPLARRRRGNSSGGYVHDTDCYSKMVGFEFGAAVLAAVLNIGTVSASDNGLALTPQMGWVCLGILITLIGRPMNSLTPVQIEHLELFWL